MESNQDEHREIAGAFLGEILFTQALVTRRMWPLTNDLFTAIVPAKKKRRKNQESKKGEVVFHYNCVKHSNGLRIF